MTHLASTSASGSSMRISKIEIAGMMRMKMNMAKAKKPKVPAKNVVVPARGECNVPTTTAGSRDSGW